MPSLWVVMLSVVTYGSIGVCLYLFRHQIHCLFTWPTTPVLRRVWIMWLLFLAILAPLSAFPDDMIVWLHSARFTVVGHHMARGYVYLPIYAQFLAGLWLPFTVLRPVSAEIVLLYLIHAPVLFGYAYCSAMLARFAPDQPQIAAMGIALNPVLILYVFQGQNHVVMLTCLLAALWLLRQGRWFWAGIMVGLGCYKFMLLPSAAVLTVIVLHRYGWKRVIPFVVGGVLTLIPSAVYYAYYPHPLLKIIANFGSVGGHSQSLEAYHFLYFIGNRVEGLGDFYLQKHIWLMVIVAAAGISAMLYWRGKINSLQALGITEAIICIAAPETYHLEPMIGLLWLDAARRRDLNLHTALFATLLTFSAAWYPYLEWHFETGAMQLLMFMWEPIGMIVGAAAISAIVFVLRGGAGDSEVLDDQNSLIVQRNG